MRYTREREASPGIILRKKKKKKERKGKNKKLRTFSFDSNVEAVIMAHFLNRAVILDSSDKRKVTRASGSNNIKLPSAIPVH